MDKFWEKQGWEADDRHLGRLANLPFRREFPFIPKESGLYVIRGPRQIGKSSWLKTILSKSLAEQRSCFYISCELIKDYRELAEVLKSLRGTEIILIDEITFVEEWWRAVKHEIDAGHHKVVVATGSHAHDLKKGLDLMPGRWGHGGEFELLPMSLFEFQAMRRMAGWPELDWKTLVESYFVVGGFPDAVYEGGPNAQLPKKSMETYRRWLLGDVLKLGKQEEYLKDIVLQLAMTATTPISLQTLAKRSQLGSHHTAADYVQILESCFAIKTLYAINPDTSQYHYRKDKKFYFRDPLLLQLAFQWNRQALPKNYFELAAETAAHEFLLQTKNEKFGYYPSGKGEIDFFAPRHWAYEVKWSALPTNLSEAYKKLQSVEKTVWCQDNFLKT